MAELATSVARHKKGRGVKKSKKLSTRVDLTPMVDLGFLLITFFIFTTTMSLPKAMNLHLPMDSKDSMLTKRSAVITIIPGKDDRIYYYEGDDMTNLQEADFKSIRGILLDKKRRTDPTWFQVIIKPTRDATYKNTVDVLDEMLIDEISHYSLVDVSPAEYQVIDTLRQPH
ncbi:MAG TPA: biopolymer transporter ExbD [Puia sp.]|jgi:biopolymer transport protein ExbD|nr:biopolymer transporter ExbD [Puia sp.]